MNPAYKFRQPGGFTKLFLLLAFWAGCAPPPPDGDWPAYGGGPAFHQYATLDQIHTGNVDQLEVAWTYKTDDQKPSSFKNSPLIVDGVLYGATPAIRIVALDAATGEEHWSFDPRTVDPEGRTHANRGLLYWSDGDDRRILFVFGTFLYALDADTGQPVASFGDNGQVDFREGLGTPDLYVTTTSPGVIYKNLLITGSTVSETLPAAPGHIRAFDVVTGELAWIFHTIPQPGEPGYDTWPEDAWQTIGGANNWAGMSLDEERGIAYVPTGSPTYDFYGANRTGQNLFANSIIALDAETGERLWHFQTVHHDLWDRDLPAPPNLVTITHDGREIDAVAQVTKQGFVFVLDRETGEPLFPVDEIPVPPSSLPEEQAWPTQPVPRKPPPFTRQTINEDNLSRMSPETEAAVRTSFEQYASGSTFLPPSPDGVLIVPASGGGAGYGGAAFDPETGRLYVNANEAPWILRLIDVEAEAAEAAAKGADLYKIHCASCHGAEQQGGDYIPALPDLKDRLNFLQVAGIIREGQGLMPGFGQLSREQIGALAAYLLNQEPREAQLQAEASEAPRPDPFRLRYRQQGHDILTDPDGYPAISPPWGTLTAINLNTGELDWQVPLGEYEELTARGIPPTGIHNLGGPIVTAGGLLFIAATDDAKFRAFDTETGDLLWETALPGPGPANPATYEVEGTQYVVIAAGGEEPQYVAFALP